VADALRPLTAKVESVVKQVSEAASNNGGAGDEELKKDLMNLKAQLQDVVTKVSASKQEREQLQKSIQEFAKDASALGGLKEKVDKVAKASDLESLQDTIKQEASKTNDVAKQGIGKVGKIVTSNNKFVKQIYKDLHMPA